MIAQPWGSLDAAALAPLYAGERRRWLDALRWDSTASWQEVEHARIAWGLPGFVAFDRTGAVRGMAFYLQEEGRIDIGGLMADDVEATDCLLDALVDAAASAGVGTIRILALDAAVALASGLRVRGFDVEPHYYLSLDLVNARPLSAVLSSATPAADPLAPRWAGAPRWPGAPRWAASRRRAGLPPSLKLRRAGAQQARPVLRIPTPVEPQHEQRPAEPQHNQRPAEPTFRSVPSDGSGHGCPHVDAWRPGDEHAAAVLLARAYDPDAAALFAPNREHAEWVRYVHNLVTHIGCGTFNATHTGAMRDGDLLRGVAIITDIGPGTAHLVQLAVDPVLRGRGAGTHLLEHVMASLKAAGYSALTLMVAQGNGAARALYDRTGFRHDATFLSGVMRLDAGSRLRPAI